jgi:hypothetical protein
VGSFLLSSTPTTLPFQEICSQESGSPSQAPAAPYLTFYESEPGFKGRVSTAGSTHLGG